MDKLKMAHEVACAMINNGCSMHTAIADAWRYADAMQAEADKRKPMHQGGYVEQIKSSVGGVVVPACIESFKDGVIFKTNNEPVFPKLKGLDDFQIDWGQAPFAAKAWRVASDNQAAWVDKYSRYIDKAPSFNYTGAWQDSLRKRPQEDK